MPTPIEHLAAAEGVLLHPRLPEPICAALQACHPAYLLGSTAPDLCSLTGDARETTHFFVMPMTDRTPAHLRLLQAFPELSRIARVPSDQAAFLAGYLSHLWLDQAWIAAIFEPFFGPDVRRGLFHERLTEHNVLRARLDREAYRSLPANLGEILGASAPDNWLPCIPEKALWCWRDHLADQLKPGGRLQTVAVFAERAGMPVEEFSTRIASSPGFDLTPRHHLPDRRLNAYRRLALAGCLELVIAFLRGSLDEAPLTSHPFRKRIIPHHEQVREHP